MTGWPASDSARMLARRYHDDRCQNRLAAASASTWVDSSASSSASHARPDRIVGQDGGAVECLGRRPHRLRAEARAPPAGTASARRSRRSPEKTVRIVTFCPSSRRLAIRPPQERATSSGWGATKTWVMAGRVYRAHSPARRSEERVEALVGEAARPDERHEDAGAVGRLDPVVPMPDREGQDLPVAWPDRDDEAPAVGRAGRAARPGSTARPRSR